MSCCSWIPGQTSPCCPVLPSRIVENGEPLNQLLHDLYDRASYDLAIDYSQPPVPPLYDDDAAWARQLLSAG
jgi:hypothetical protein